MNYPTPAEGNVNCKSCLTLNVKGCIECRRCTVNCGCRCKLCANCKQKHITGMCRLCGSCQRATSSDGNPAWHCTCRTRPRAQKIHPPKLAVFKRHRLRRPVGVEIELASPGDLAAIQRGSPVQMQWVHDGSVTAGGIECVVNPMVGGQLVEGLGFLADQFARYGSTVDPTCGYHVHVGAAEFSVYELRRLLLLYHRFEDVFYELVEPGRDKPKINGRGESRCYCQRLGWRAEWYEQLARLERPEHIKRFLLASLYPSWVQANRNNIDMRGLRRHKYEACRYFGLNLHTWFERGTVEYRHHEGTVDKSRLLNWAQWCAWFTEFASALSDQQVRECTSLNDLLWEPWKTGAGILRMPSDVVAYVMQTREEMRALAARQAAKKEKTAARRTVITTTT